MRELFEDQVAKLKEVITEEIEKLKNEVKKRAKKEAKLSRKVVGGLFFCSINFIGHGYI